MPSKGVFIDRSKIKQILDKTAAHEWPAVSSDDLTIAGNATRYSFIVNGKFAMLNLFFNKDGTTTISPTGKNQELSSRLKLLVESSIHTKAEITAAYSYKNVPQVWIDKLVAYLKSLERVTYTTGRFDHIPAHNCYQFMSSLGDKLTVNVYDNHTLTLQGKPAYLYGMVKHYLYYRIATIFLLMKL